MIHPLVGQFVDVVDGINKYSGHVVDIGFLPTNNPDHSTYVCSVLDAETLTLRFPKPSQLKFKYNPF